MRLKKQSWFVMLFAVLTVCSAALLIVAWGTPFAIPSGLVLGLSVVFLVSRIRYETLLRSDRT